MTEIAEWLATAARREQNVVRLEDALLTDRYGRYFWFRLRYFGIRTLVAVMENYQRADGSIEIPAALAVNEPDG